MFIEDEEAKHLLDIEKVFVLPTRIIVRPGDKLERDLESRDRREKFKLDVYHGKAILSKYTIQKRARSVIPLARLDIGPGAHTNPDGVVVRGPHLHIYRREYELRFAYPLADLRSFRGGADFCQSLEDFALYCNIQDVPPVQLVLL